MNQVNANRIMALRKATGLGILEAKKFLSENPERLSNQILLAYKKKQQRIKQGFKTRPYLYDPIEDDEKYSDIIKKAKMRVFAIIKEENKRNFVELEKQNLVHTRSSSLRHMRKLKQYLWENHQIEWFTYQEMNPGWIIE